MAANQAQNQRDYTGSTVCVQSEQSTKEVNKTPNTGLQLRFETPDHPLNFPENR